MIRSLHLECNTVQQKGGAMDDVMVTARMSKQRKAEGNRVLAKAGLNASQAINLLFDRLVQEQDVSFLEAPSGIASQAAWDDAASFVDSLLLPSSDFPVPEDKGSIKVARLKARGLM